MQAEYTPTLRDQQMAPCSRSLSYRVIKRGLDLLCSAVILTVLSPVIAASAIAIKLTSPGPVFYRWEVLGRNAQSFVGYKLRTMVADADGAKAQLWPYNERNGPLFKMKDDPRITPLGRWLRRFSLDELPQLWSVLKGDMSLVGPRPVSPAEWRHFAGWQRRKLTLTPGCISPWHVLGKTKQFDEWVRLELWYIDHWSLSLDIRILLGGLWYVLAGRNY